MYFEPKLNLTSRIQSIGDCPELRGSEDSARVAEVRVVENVEEIAAQLDRAPLKERPGLVGGKIRVDQRVGTQDVAAQIAARVGRRHRKRESVKPASNGLVH